MVADSNTESLFSFGTRLPKVAVTLQALRNTLKSQLIVDALAVLSANTHDTNFFQRKFFSAFIHMSKVGLDKDHIQKVLKQGTVIQDV